MRNGKIISIGLLIALTFIFLSHMNGVIHASEMEVLEAGDKVYTVGETVKVTDLEVGYEEELEVGGTQTLSVKVLPSDATDTLVTYTSSDTSILAVSSTGEIKGVAKGNATITIQAGDIIKTITIRVKVSGKTINVNKKDLVLNPGEEFVLSANVSPEDADQSLTYESLDTSVVTVGDGGRVRAKEPGSTTIILSNGDIATKVSVLVNMDTQDTAPVGEDTVRPGEEITEAEQELLTLLGESDQVEIQTGQYEVLTKNVLKKMQERKVELLVQGEGYTLTVCGKDILNYENTLSTNISFCKEKKGYSFILNEESKLPGKVYLLVNDSVLDGGYLYLYNNAKEKYELLRVKDDSGFALDKSGKYYITDVKISSIPVNMWVIIVTGAILIGLAAGYIIVKKKYGFGKRG